MSNLQTPGSMVVDYLVYRYDPPNLGGGLSGFMPAESNLAPGERDWWHKKFRYWWEPRGTDVTWGPSVCYLIALDPNAARRAILCYRTAKSSVGREGTASFLLIGSPAELTAGVALALADWRWAVDTLFDPNREPDPHWHADDRGVSVPMPSEFPHTAPAAGDKEFDGILSRIIVDLLENAGNDPYGYHLLVPDVGPVMAVELLGHVLGVLDNDWCGKILEYFSFSTSQKGGIPAATAPRVIFATQDFTWEGGTGGDLAILGARKQPPKPEYLDAADLLVAATRRLDRHAFNKAISGSSFDPHDSFGSCGRLIRNGRLRQFLDKGDGNPIPAPPPTPPPCDVEPTLEFSVSPKAEVEAPPLPALAPPEPQFGSADRGPVRKHLIEVCGWGVRLLNTAATETAIVNVLVDVIRDLAWLRERDVLALRYASQVRLAPTEKFDRSKFEPRRRPDQIGRTISNPVLRVVDKAFTAIADESSDTMNLLLGAVRDAMEEADPSYANAPGEELGRLRGVVRDRQGEFARQLAARQRTAAREAREAVGALCEGRLLAGIRDESSRITAQNPPSTFEIIDLLVDLFRLGGGLTGPHVATLHWICLRRFRDSPFPIPSVVANDTQALEDLRTEVRRWKRTVENRAFEEALRTECAARVQYGREIVQKVISDVTVVGLRDQELIDRLVAGIYSLAGEPVDPEIQRELEKLRGQARWAFGRDRATAPALPTGPPPTVNRYHPQATDESPSATRPTVPRPKGADLTPLGRAPQTDADYRRPQKTWQSTGSSSPPTQVPALPPGPSHRPGEWTSAAGTGASPASGVEQNGRPGRISLRDPRVFVPVIILIFIVLVVLMIVTADREKIPVGISVVGVDGEFKKVVNSGGVWQAPDVPAVFAEAVLHAASARPAPDKIMLTVSRKWQDRAVSALDGASVEGIRGVSSKPAGAIVIIDPKDGGVRAVATRGQAAGNNNLAVGLAVDPGELTAVLSAVAMDKDALSRLVNPSSGEEKCGKFPDMIRYLCPGTAAFLQQQLIQGSSLDRAQKIACGLGFDGMPHSVDGVQIAASSILPGESCGATSGVAADAPIRVTPFQLAVVASALAAGSKGNPPPCPHLLVEAPANRCAIGIGDVRLAVEAAPEIRKAAAEGNPGFALLTSSASAGFVGGDKAGWAVGFAPANNPTVAIAVCVSAATAESRSVQQAARETAAAVLREVQ